MHNNNSLALWIFGAAIVVIIISIIVRQIFAKKRTQALQTTAQEMGFTFEGAEWNDPSHAPRLNMPLFDRGSGRQFRNIMTGTAAGLKVSLFDYSFTTGGGKNSHTWTQTVAAFTQELSLPDFALRPEGFFDRIGEVFLHSDIDFDSHPDFSHRCLLRGPDEQKIRQLFSPALLSFCEALPPDYKWHIEGGGPSLVVYRSDATVNPTQVRTFLDETSSIASNFFSSCGLKRTP